MSADLVCAFCGEPAEGNSAIHRDGFCEGPTVDLCDACGLHETPTLEEIWGRISQAGALQESEVRS